MRSPSDSISRVWLYTILPDNALASFADAFIDATFIVASQMLPP